MLLSWVFWETGRLVLRGHTLSLSTYRSKSDRTRNERATTPSRLHSLRFVEDRLSPFRNSDSGRVTHDLRAGDGHLQHRYLSPDGRPTTTAPSHTINVWDVVGDAPLVKNLGQMNSLPPLSRWQWGGIPAKMYLPMSMDATDTESALSLPRQSIGDDWGCL